MQYYNAIVKTNFYGVADFKKYHNIPENKINAFIDFCHNSWIITVIFFYHHKTGVYIGFYSPKKGLNLSN